MKRPVLIGLLALSSGLAACQAAPNSASAPVTVAALPTVAIAKVVVTSPKDGLITVQGLPGAVPGKQVTLVQITVARETPQALTLLHLGHGARPYFTAHAKVTGDGAFETVSLGSTALPVQVGDQLALSLYQGTLAAGPEAGLLVPGASSP